MSFGSTKYLVSTRIPIDLNPKSRRLNSIGLDDCLSEDHLMVMNMGIYEFQLEIRNEPSSDKKSAARGQLMLTLKNSTNWGKF